MCHSCTLRIHLETSSVLIRQLPVEYVKKPQNWKYAPLSMGMALYFCNSFVFIHAHALFAASPKSILNMCVTGSHKPTYIIKMSLCTCIILVSNVFVDVLKLTMGYRAMGNPSPKYLSKYCSVLTSSVLTRRTSLYNRSHQTHV